MSFNDNQLVALLRHIENDAESQPMQSEVLDHLENVEAELRGENRSFKQTVRDRARQLAQLSGIGNQYWKFVTNTKTAVLVVTALMAMIGFVAALQALNQNDNQINIYWLLLVLLGFNTLSIILWLIFSIRAAMGGNNQTQSPIFAAYRWLISRFSKRSNRGVLFASWSESNLFGRVGQWFASRVLHGVWIAYLLGGLAAVLLAMSGKQYDFVWGTTILPQQSFVRTTESLGALPSSLGFDVPTANQIQQSEKGVSGNVTSPAELRASWASFLVACLLLYGILPRLLLWILSSINLYRAKRAYEPDWSNPYFFQLRTRLLPEHAELGIVDADQQSESLDNRAPSPAENLNSSPAAPLPTNALLASYEWGHHHLPDLDLPDATLIGAIDEKDQQKALLAKLTTTASPLILVVPLERVVDRGTSRLIERLADKSELHLAVLRRQKGSSDPARWAAWKMTAERIKLPGEQVHLISLVSDQQ